MIVEEKREWRRLEMARLQPKLCFLNFSLRETLQHVRLQHFPGIKSDPKVYFVDRGREGKRESWMIPMESANS
jgi:hypothetical protein